ncbi:RnfABCDGE type electron transport complex subunit D [Agaribacterium sp. ZY112]|uniref:RnfABCDGE type electron transport complex subunit D n=1 Tax=Agaribacterium sp. ZY112 TaxID=3233574 RepID=UPI003525AF06
MSQANCSSQLLDKHCGPYAHSGSSVRKHMWQVCLALTPCTLFSLYLFGWPAIFLFFCTCLSALLFEALCLYMRKDPLVRVMDGSALLCAWILALTLPPWAPWWLGVGGAFFAIVVGKQLYGGLGQNIFNPAMLARTALLITFPMQMTTWVEPTPIVLSSSPDFFSALLISFSSATNIDAYSGATALGSLKTALSMGQNVEQGLAELYQPLYAFIGWSSGSMGESSELLILLGAVYLLWQRIISWEIPVAMLLGLFVFTQLSHILDGEHYAAASFHLFSGGVVLAAFFIATDPVSSPSSSLGRIVFGLGCALLIFIIRNWGSFPEAVAFAVLIMNAFNPLIERYLRPRIYGRLANKEALPNLASFELAQKLKRPKS